MLAAMTGPDQTTAEIAVASRMVRVMFIGVVLRAGPE